MKVTGKAAAFLVGAALICSVIGFFYAYYFSWLITTPGVAAGARQHYDLLSRVIGIPSLILFAASIASGVWLMFRRRSR